ncbi:MAG: cell division protein FtsA [Abditibacteriales bacterium]|nr:cell division protein FtsA [Abditibacteriales bacterium]MDW8367037.1 cell division protein FtsA [Abditibacteriales bacterium]
MSQDILAGLDIGTTKVCTVVGRAEGEGRLRVEGVGVAACHGLQKSIVVDVEETVRAVRQSVEEAQHMARAEIRAVCVGVTGEHIRCMNKHGTVTVPSGRISEEDVARVMASTAVELPPGRVLIGEPIPRGFAVDGQSGVRRPVGMVGTRLEVETHIVTGTASFIANVVQCVEQAGLEVAHLVLGPIATGELIATQAEKDLGVVLIDIGGGTTDVAVFVDGSIAFSAAVPVAGNHVTRDISIGLRTPSESAERLKRERGAAMKRFIAADETIEVVSAGTGERLRLPRQVLGEIIEARMVELFSLVRAKIEESNLYNRLAIGAILTGGGSLLTGTVECAQEVLELPTRLGRPSGLNDWTNKVDSPMFSTGVGLLYYAAHRPRRSNHTPPRPPNFTARLRSFFRRLSGGNEVKVKREA